jgi:hypothetical protein
VKRRGMKRREKFGMEEQVKRRKSVPHAFVLEELGAVEYRTRAMFGCVAVYVGEKIVMALRDKPEHRSDNGVWLATTRDHHTSLRREFPNMRSIGLLGEAVTSWQVLAMDTPDFEESVVRACELIKKGDERIGKVPERKRKKSMRVGPGIRRRATPVREP